MRGCIKERSRGHYAIILDRRDPQTQKRRRKWISFKGTLRQAEAECARLVAEIADHTYVDRNRNSLNDFLDGFERDWIPMNVSPKSAERYHSLLKHNIRPYLGAKPMQAIRPQDINELYTKLRETLAPLSVRHVHRLLYRIFKLATKWGAVKRNVVELVDSPKVPHSEAAALKTNEIPQMLAALRGTEMFAIAAVALGTGMRRGELLALQWSAVDLDGGKLEVKRSLEETRAGLRFKPPKSANGRRTVTLAPAVATELRNRRTRQLEQRMELGLGKPPADALVFCKWDGAPISPDQLSHNFGGAMTKAGLPHITLHSLRHTHASQLITSGMDILTVSRRLGHANASITLNTYGHVVNPTDKAADIVQAALGGLLG